ncbi:cytochrome P450 [Conidiobolus coronatus NRRL 28638]|uniref:Cytochrome P450 n=1 Tax=Conidiobolus coronatus (strain ATCC 28846 / CBS 209.66 / NRRL 28638) TaxID=796925 RepID=A0A137PIW1_CONC2|nr:cytochrome P450 [Conidiobolus coronatus NRRL 28638]|eukprot:KXN74933.1 cytochrome P450 [Conidiobolus coronatus NRRL 28638]
MLYLLICCFIVALGVLYLIKVPENFKNVPRVSILSTLHSIITRKTVQEHHSKILAPKLSKSGFAIVWVRGGWSLHISKPSAIKQILKNTRVFTKFRIHPASLNRRFTGKRNIVRSDGEEWRRYRKPVNSIFIQSFCTKMFADCVKEALSVLEYRVNEFSGKPVVVSDLMEYMTLDILGKGVFGYDFKAIKNMGASHYHHLYKTVFNGVQSALFLYFPILEYFPIFGRSKLHKNCDEFNKFIGEMVSKRRKEIEKYKNSDYKDVLSLMLENDPDSPYEPFSDEEIIGNLNIFIIAGHDSTAHTLSYTMYYLAKDQNIQQKLRNEVYKTIEIPANQAEIVAPNTESLKDMVYMDCVLKEAMRMSPAVVNLHRHVAEEFQFPGEDIVVPKDNLVSIAIYGVQNDPKIHQNPKIFSPERFINTRYDTDTYLPFGGGSRMCLGMNFSLTEQKVYLSMLLQKFTIQIHKDNPDFERLRMNGLIFSKAKDLKLNFVQRF